MALTKPLILEKSSTQTADSHSELKTTADKYKSKRDVGALNMRNQLAAREKQKSEKTSLKEKADVRNPPIPPWAKAYPEDSEYMC